MQSRKEKCAATGMTNIILLTPFLIFTQELYNRDSLPFTQASLPSGNVIKRVDELYTISVPQLRKIFQMINALGRKSKYEVNQKDIYLTTYFVHFTELVEPPLDTERMVPKKEVFSVPQLGQGP